MSAVRLLREARAAGLKLGVSPNGKLKCRGPVPVLERLKPALAQHRNELLAALRAERDEVAVVVPTAGDDPFEVARTLITIARAQDAAGELPAGRRYQLRLVDQHDADRRNAEAIRAGVTDRFCKCGAMARCEWIVDGRPTWQCDECAPTRGRA